MYFDFDDLILEKKRLIGELDKKRKKLEPVVDSLNNYLRQLKHIMEVCYDEDISFQLELTRVQVECNGASFVVSNYSKCKLLVIELNNSNVISNDRLSYKVSSPCYDLGAFTLNSITKDSAQLTDEADALYDTIDDVLSSCMDKIQSELQRQISKMKNWLTLPDKEIKRN